MKLDTIEDIFEAITAQNGACEGVHRPMCRDIGPNKLVCPFKQDQLGEHSHCRINMRRGDDYRNILKMVRAEYDAKNNHIGGDE